MNLEQLLEFLRGRGRQGNPYEGLRLQQEGAAREDANRAIQQRNQQMNMDRMNQMNRMRPQMPQMGRGMGRDMPSSQMLQGPQGDMNRMRMQQQMQQPLRPQMPNMPQMQEQMQQQMGRLNDQDLQKLHQQMQQQSAPAADLNGVAGSLLGRPPMSEMQRRMMNQRMMAPRFGASFGVQR